MQMVKIPCVVRRTKEEHHSVTMSVLQSTSVIEPVIVKMYLALIFTLFQSEKTSIIIVFEGKKNN